MNNHMPHRLYPISMTPLSREILLLQVDDCGDYDDEKRMKWRDAVNFLKSELGKGFFQQNGMNHSVYQKLSNLGRVDELMDFVTTLQQIKDTDSNYPFLKRKIISCKDCQNEGEFFVDIARDFLAAGFQVYFLDHRNAYHKKTPDIKLTDPRTNEIIFIEVCRMDDSADRILSGEEHILIGNTIIRYGYDLFHSCKQLQHMSPGELEQIIEKIKEVKDQAAADEKVIHFSNEFIDLVFAHPSKIEEFRQWWAGNIRQPGISGMSVEFNDTRRIKQQGKIGDTVKQLPADGSGLLYIHVPVLFFLFYDISESFALLSEELLKYPHVLGIVVFSELGQPMKEINAAFGKHVYRVRPQNRLMKYRMFVHNDAYKASWIGIRY